MALIRKDLDEMDEDCKSLVNGCIRKWTESFDLLVPDLVIHTILSFYYYVLFGDCSENLELSKSGWNEVTITNSGDDNAWTNSAYSKQWIPWLKCKGIPMIKWKITNNASNGCLQVGIITNQHHQNTGADIDGEGSYIYCFNGELWENGEEHGTAPSLEEGHSAILTLDLRRSQINIGMLVDDTITNEETYFDIDTGEDMKYKLAIGIFYVGDSMTVSLES